MSIGTRIRCERNSLNSFGGMRVFVCMRSRWPADGSVCHNSFPIFLTDSALETTSSAESRSIILVTLHTAQYQPYKFCALIFHRQCISSAANIFSHFPKKYFEGSTFVIYTSILIFDIYLKSYFQYYIYICIHIFLTYNI